MCEVYPIKDNSVVEKMQELMIQDNNSRIHFLFTVGIKSGFRISDILNLTYEDIRGKTHFDVVEKKTKKRRTIAIHPAILAAFEKYDNGETGLLFTSNSNRNRGKAFSRIYVVNELKKYAELAGFKRNVGTHTMRKTFGYRVYQATNNLATVQKLLNHSNSGHTLRYIGIEAEELDDAIMGI
jgi:integrase